MLENQTVSTATDTTQHISTVAKRVVPRPPSFWDFYARTYDKVAKTRAYGEMMADVVAAVNPQPGQRILDVGCGTGNLQFNLDLMCRGIDHIGLDFSDAMLHVATEKNPNADYRRWDLNHQPWTILDDASVDTVVCVNNLYTLADPQMALREMYRVLKPGGKLVIANPKPGFNPMAILADHCRRADFEGWKEIFRNTFNIITILGVNALIVNRGNKQVYHFTDALQLTTLAQAAGFDPQVIRETYAAQDVFTVLVK